MVPNFAHVTRRVASLLPVLLISAVLAACSQTTPAPTQAPTPTPTTAPTPTPEPTPPPVAAPGDASLPTPDPVRMARLSHLVSLVPGEYVSAVFMDVQALRERPLLQETLDLETLGLQGALPAVGTGLLDGLLVAADEEGNGAITVAEGAIEVESLLQMASGFGIALGGPEAEQYRDHQVWSMDVFGATLAIGEADDSTTVFSSGSPLGGAPAGDLVKGALDTFDGLAPGLLADPDMSRLAGRLPSGFVTTLLRRCGDLGDLGAGVDLPGCTGAGVSADLLDDGTVAFYGLAGFENESLASAAFDEAVKRIEAGASTPFGEVVVHREGALVWSRVLVGPEQLAAAVQALTLPEG